MFDWIRNHSLIEYIEEELRIDVSHPGFRMEQLLLDQEPEQMTALAQFFAAVSVWGNDNTMNIIPVDDGEVRKLVMDELSIHYQNVRLCIEEHRTQLVYLQQMKTKSAELFATANPKFMMVLEDLYREPRSKDQMHLMGKKRSLLYYSVDPSSLTSFDVDGTASLKLLLNQTYLERGESFVLQPRGWVLDDGLSESLALRFFAGFVPALTLVVDADTDQVISLELSRAEIRHEVELNGARPSAPRRNNHFLYLDLGGGLIYVIDLEGQPEVKTWEDINKRDVYKLEDKERFAQFDHERAEPISGGFSIFLDQDSLESLLEAVNRKLKKG